MAWVFNSEIGFLRIRHQNIAKTEKQANAAINAADTHVLLKKFEKDIGAVAADDALEVMQGVRDAINKSDKSPVSIVRILREAMSPGKAQQVFIERLNSIDHEVNGYENYIVTDVPVLYLLEHIEEVGSSMACMPHRTMLHAVWFPRCAMVWCRSLH